MEYFLRTPESVNLRWSMTPRYLEGGQEDPNHGDRQNIKESFRSLFSPNVNQSGGNEHAPTSAQNEFITSFLDENQLVPDLRNSPQLHHNRMATPLIKPEGSPFFSEPLDESPFIQKIVDSGRQRPPLPQSPMFGGVAVNRESVHRHISMPFVYGPPPSHSQSTPILPHQMPHNLQHAVSVPHVPRGHPLLSPQQIIDPSQYQRIQYGPIQGGQAMQHYLPVDSAPDTRVADHNTNVHKELNVDESVAAKKEDRRLREAREKEDLIREFKRKTREAALIRFRQKRRERNFGKNIRYDCRKKLADRRPRVRGRFVKRPEEQLPANDSTPESLTDSRIAAVFEDRI